MRRIVRYSLIFRQRPAAVASWSAWELDLLDAFIEKESHSSDRIEVILARLTAMFANVHRGKGIRPVKAQDFLPQMNAWPSPQNGRYSDIDKEILSELL